MTQVAIGKVLRALRLRRSRAAYSWRVAPARIDEPWREQTDRERELIETLLLADFPGREQIATHVRGARVRTTCLWPCGTFAIERRDGLMPTSVSNGEVAGADGLDDEGNGVGVWIAVRGGYADFIENCGHASTPVGLPVPASLTGSRVTHVKDGVTFSVLRDETLLEEARRLDRPPD